MEFQFGRIRIPSRDRKGKVKSRIVLLCTAFLLSGAAQAEMGFPDSVKLPAQIQQDPDQTLVDEAMGRAEIETDATGNKQELTGHHFARWFRYAPAAGEPALGYDNGSEERIQKALLSTLAPAGWAIAFDTEQHGYFTLKQGEGAGASYLLVKMSAPEGQVFLELVAPGEAASGFKVPAPQAKPETFKDADDIPYLPPYPGSTRTGGGHGDDPLDVAEPGKGGEPMLVGAPVVSRDYQGPSSLSNLQFITDYHRALTEAGWDVLYPKDPSAGGYGSLAAHYAKNGRNIWARLSYQLGATLNYQIVDAGSRDIKSELQKACHVALYGVFFDFDKATLKPESDAVLNKALATIGAVKSGLIEVQGHTDAVGSDDYNLKLSNDRAASVRDWFVAHGVAAKRLTSKGYGKSHPVADNGTDAGRAKNRRVELAIPGCKAK